MTDRTWKKLQFILLNMAREDPNEFIRQIYYSGIDEEDIEELRYLVSIARRAQGYDLEQDLLRLNSIC